MAKEDRIQFFQVMDSQRDRTMFLLILHCGLASGGSQCADLVRQAHESGDLPGSG